MKVGDLVKHPQGMKNVCPTSYSLGVVVEIITGGIWPQARVVWTSGMGGTFVYLSEHLVVINEGV